MVRGFVVAVFARLREWRDGSHRKRGFRWPDLDAFEQRLASLKGPR